MESTVEKSFETKSDYEQDFYAWTQEQARLLKLGNLSRLDVKNLIEEVEDMGRSELRSLDSAIKQAVLHLAKLAYSPSEDPRAGWNASVVKQRDEIEELLEANPSFKSKLDRSFEKVWPGARKIAIADLAVFNEKPVIPIECPFTLSNLRDEGFLPVRVSASPL